MQSKRAVEIETLKAQAEVEPLRQLNEQLVGFENSRRGALQSYMRNVRLSLYSKAQQVIMEEKKS